MVRTFEELKQRRHEAKGKIVVFNHPMPQTDPSTFSAYGAAVTYRSRGASEAAKAGAVAAIVRSMTTRLDDFPHTGGMRYAEGPPKIPTAAVEHTRGGENQAAPWLPVAGWCSTFSRTARPFPTRRAST